MSNSLLPSQSFTPTSLASLPSKESLVQAFKGKPVESVRTPALFIDRAIFNRNCEKMNESIKTWDARFRAHVKTHKTAEGARLQLQWSRAVIVSTLMEAWQIIESGLVKDGTIDDILYGLPVGPSKIADLAKIRDSMVSQNAGASLRILIDSVAQVKALEAFGTNRIWSAFVKVDHGGKRAGLPPQSEAIKALIQASLQSPAVTIFGFYCHAGDSYASTSVEEASSFLNTEMQAVNHVANLALSMMKDLQQANPNIDLSRHRSPFVLSVGSTPTAHSAAHPEGAITSQVVKKALTGGELEIHAGNYPMCDLQQFHTGLIKVPDIAHRVLASVIGYYPGRGLDGSDEALCDAGGIAMSKDVGPIAGYGDVVSWRPVDPDSPPVWKLGRISQEHGILIRNPQAHNTNRANTDLQPGDFIWIIGQHACLTAAAHPWYYVLDSSIDGGSETIQEVWVPWKGW